jgi:hypothetical protein
MSKHLSEDQFEKCISRRAGPSEHEHMSECPECRAEVERFSKGLALFRRAVQDLAIESAGLEKAHFTKPSAALPGIPRWRWAVATATLAAAVVLSFFIPRPRPIPNTPAEINRAETSPEAVMERLNRHLARTVPEAMEPAMSLFSAGRPGNGTGGVQ